MFVWAAVSLSKKIQRIYPTLGTCMVVTSQCVNSNVRLLFNMGCKIDVIDLIELKILLRIYAILFKLNKANNWFKYKNELCPEISYPLMVMLYWFLHFTN